MKLFGKIKEIFSKKKWVRIISYAAACLIVLLIVLVLFLGHIVKGTIQTIGPMITGVPITVEEIHVGVIGHFRVRIKNLIVGNPKGYSSSCALKMENFKLSVNTLSLLSGKMIVNRLELTGVRLNFETNLISSNLTDINNNISKLTAGSGNKSSAPAAETAAVEKKSGSPKKLQVNAIEISDITVAVIAKGSDTAAVPIPMVPISMRDLGTGPEGITPAALTQEILTKLMTGISDTAVSGTKALSDSAKSAADSTGKVINDAGKSVNDAAQKTGQFFKGMFGGKK